jgi:hypothetical protein
MNMFYLHSDPKLCAEWAVDSHCVKMILESAQLLSTAHRVLDGIEYTDKTKTGRNVKRWRLDDWREDKIYVATHINHPCSVWCRETSGNYRWLHDLMTHYCIEYTYRYGKTHKIEQTDLLAHLSMLPNNIKRADFTSPPSAMDAKYIISNEPITNYRNYYAVGKIHLHKWKNRKQPDWIQTYQLE